MARMKSTAGVWLDRTTGRWRWKVERRRPDGTTFSKNGSRKTQADAEAMHSQALALFESGDESVQSSRYTLKAWGQYCEASIWTHPSAMKYNTRHNYGLDLKNHVYSHKLSAVFLDAFSTAHMRALLKDVGGSQYLQANVRNAVARLLKDAQGEGVIPEGRRATDSVVSARNTKKRDTEGNVIETFRVLSQAEKDALLKTAEGHWAYIGILLQLKMGLRRGEVAAMRWQDIKNDILHVSEQLVRRKGEGVFREDTKSASSVRKIALPKIVKDALEGAGTIHLVERDGKRVTPDAYAKAVKDLLDASGCNGTDDEPIKPSASSHDLRHTFGSDAACKWNFPIKTLSTILGHANITTTLGYYIHADAGDISQSMALVA